VPAVPEIIAVPLVTPDAGSAGAPQGAESLAEAGRRILDTEINLAIAAHRGHVTIAGTTDGWSASASKADARAAAWPK
jgi:hypothetical protein